MTCASWAGKCNPWDKVKNKTTPCSAGVCDRDVCCTRNCPHPHTMCKGAVEDFNPPISGDVMAAVAKCKQLGRAECFAVLDATGDGQDLKRCVETGEKNEHKNFLLSYSPTSDVCFYVPATPTCGNTYRGTCGIGMKVAFDTPCNGTTCSEETCCKPLVMTLCSSGNVTCPAGEKHRTVKTMCAGKVCTAEECCEVMTCGADWGRTPSQRCAGWNTPLPGETECGDGGCSNHTCCKEGTLPPTTTVPCSTVAQTPPPVAQDPCGGQPKYIESEKDTVACPAGYAIISTVGECVEGAQFLEIQPSDTNGDGIKVDLHNTTAMLSWLGTREIGATHDLGNKKPYGCYSDKSIRLVEGSQKLVTTIWVNHNQAASGPHDNSAPICKSTCVAPAVLTTTAMAAPTTTATAAPKDPCSGKPKYIEGVKDTVACPAGGYAIISTVGECVEGAQFLDIQPSDTNGDGIAVDLHNTTAMLTWLRAREIGATSYLGNKKPYGCYSDKSIRIVNGARKLVTTVWVNHNQAASGPHDNSAPICKSTCVSPAGVTNVTAVAAPATAALALPEAPGVVVTSTVPFPAALYDASHKEEGEQIHRGSGLAAESPGSLALTNGVAFAMLVGAFALVARSLRIRQQRKRADTIRKVLVEDEEMLLATQQTLPSESEIAEILI